MSAPSAKLNRRRVKELASRLIEIEMGLKAGPNLTETEVANRQMALDFCLENLDEHTFLDADPVRVQEAYDGLSEQFLANAEFELADNLGSYLAAFNQTKAFHSHSRLAILALLLELSHSPGQSGIASVPLSQLVATRVDRPAQERAEVMQVLRTLNEEVPHLSLSEWNRALDEYESDKEENEEEEEEEEEEESGGEVGESSLLPVETTTVTTSSLPASPAAVNGETTDVGLTQLARTFQPRRIAEGMLDVGGGQSSQWPLYVPITEPEVVREVLHMLAGRPGRIFQLQKQGDGAGRFSQHETIQVKHLSPGCLRRSLEFFIDLSNTAIAIETTSRRCQHSTRGPMLQAIGAVIDAHLNATYRTKLVQLEGSCRGLSPLSESNRSPHPTYQVTILSLCTELADTAARLDFLRKLLSSALDTALLDAVDANSDTDPEAPCEWHVVSEVLSCLYEEAQRQAVVGRYALMTLSLGLFAIGMRLLLLQLDGWMMDGVVAASLPIVPPPLHPPSSAVGGERYVTVPPTTPSWSGSFIQPDVVFQGRVISSFPSMILDHVVRQIVVAGKSVILLKSLNKHTREGPVSSCCEGLERGLAALFPVVPADLSAQMTATPPSLVSSSPTMVDTVPSASFPILHRKYGDIFCPLPTPSPGVMGLTDPGTLPDMGSLSVAHWLLTHEVEAGRPHAQVLGRQSIRAMFESSVLEPLVRQSAHVSKLLLRTMMWDSGLVVHLTIMKNVFLMGAGDSLHSFLESAVFSKLDVAQRPCEYHCWSGHATEQPTSESRRGCVDIPVGELFDAPSMRLALREAAALSVPNDEVVFPEPMHTQAATTHDFWGDDAEMGLKAMVMSVDSLDVNVIASTDPSDDATPSSSSSEESVKQAGYFGASATDVISVMCVPPWPVDLVLNDEAFSHYQSLFRFLVRLKRARHGLLRTGAGRDVFRGVVRLPAVARPSDQDEIPRQLVHRSLLLRARLLHFIDSLLEYVMTTVIQSEWEGFQDRVRSCSSIDRLIYVHRHFLSRIRDRCLLGPKATPLARAVNTALDACIRFDVLHRATLRLLGNVGETTDGGQPTVQHLLSTLRLLDQDFDRAMRFLLTVLRQISSTPGPQASGLTDLFNRWNYNQFYEVL